MNIKNIFHFMSICLAIKISSVLQFPEASKVIMQYVAEVSGKGENIDTVKEQLLQSNPVLEGNLMHYG